MKPVPLTTYRIFCVVAIIAFAVCLYANRHVSAVDNHLFRIIRGWKCSFLDSACTVLIEPKYWIPWYNFVLIILYLHFGLKFTKVVFGIVLVVFVAWLLSESSARVGVAGRFSYQHVAQVSALATYLCIVLYGSKTWFKALAITAALIISFSCIYVGTLLPSTVLTAILTGILTTAAVSFVYVRQILLREPAV